MFTVPNAQDVPFLDQSEPDAVDFGMLGYRATGILSGGVVSAQAVPTMSVQVTSGIAVINGGAPVPFAGSSVSVQGSSASARFDLVVVSSAGVISVVRGTPSPTNPVTPTVDLTGYAVLAAIYVRAGVVSITNSDIVRKDIRMEGSFRRSFTLNDEVFLGASAPDGSFQVDADGTHRWGGNILRRTAAAAMEMVTSLTLRAAESASAVLTLKGRSLDPGAQNVLAVRSYNDSLLASVSGTGIFTAQNFRRGTGSPEGVVTGNRGDMYVDANATDPNASLWMMFGTSGSNTGWQSFRIYDTGDVTFPTGTLVNYLGTAAPAGWIAPLGQAISTTDPTTAALAALVGSRYGASTGVVYLPDLRGFTLVGHGGDLGLTFGQMVGDDVTTLNIANLPRHAHPVVDPGHAHPRFGRGLFYSPTPGEHPDGASGWSVAVEPPDFNGTAKSNVSTLPVGSGEPFSVMQKSHAGLWICKL